VKHYNWRTDRFHDFKLG